MERHERFVVLHTQCSHCHGTVYAREGQPFTCHRCKEVNQPQQARLDDVWDWRRIFRGGAGRD